MNTNQIIVILGLIVAIAAALAPDLLVSMHSYLLRSVLLTA